MKKDEIRMESEEMKDAKEFAELYCKLKPAEKMQVKGILIGIQMMEQTKKAEVAV